MNASSPPEGYRCHIHAAGWMARPAMTCLRMRITSRAADSSVQAHGTPSETLVLVASIA